ncbi:hypothetical protein EVG20_g7222 [Dentipellis fragilis]|uniref:Uncharacterized protein n=1 Tax=Dentipellis fragilis TaxID=205917 RepID=A0A4Y9YG58_9AGAM|nr:hypothetical protein EVG20_g7222 [Dentipellis fragilis]
MSVRPDVFSAPNLPADAVARATTNARRDGAFAGLTAGLVGAIIASRMKLGQNKAIVAGIGELYFAARDHKHRQCNSRSAVRTHHAFCSHPPTATGILSGYNFTQGFLASNMSILRAEVAAQQVKNDANRNSESQEPSMQE